MSKHPVSVVNASGDHEESVERIAKWIGRSKIKQGIVSVIYGRGTRPKSVTEIMSALGLPNNQRQSVVNAAVHLAKHEVISSELAPKAAKAGGRWLYGKMPFVRANKDEILREASNGNQSKAPTKRRQAINITVVNKDGRRAPKPESKLTVLYLTSAPESEDALRTEAEMRRVQEAIRGSAYRNKVALHLRPAAGATTILDGLNDLRPQVVHFSGHGDDDGILLDDGKMAKSTGLFLDYATLANALDASDTPPSLVVLNACNSLKGARKLLKAAKAVIAMADSISDQGAGAFAAQFYAAVASAQPVGKALQQAVVALQMSAHVADSKLPKIVSRPNVDPNKLLLIRKS